jgi:hypothetical protein
MEFSVEQFQNLPRTDKFLQFSIKIRIIWNWVFSMELQSRLEVPGPKNPRNFPLLCQKLIKKSNIFQEPSICHFRHTCISALQFYSNNSLPYTVTDPPKSKKPHQESI